MQHMSDVERSITISDKEVLPRRNILEEIINLDKNNDFLDHFVEFDISGKCALAALFCTLGPSRKRDQYPSKRALQIRNRQKQIKLFTNVSGRFKLPDILVSKEENWLVHRVLDYLIKYWVGFVHRPTKSIKYVRLPLDVCRNIVNARNHGIAEIEITINEGNEYVVYNRQYRVNTQTGAMIKVGWVSINHWIVYGLNHSSLL